VLREDPAPAEIKNLLNTDPSADGHGSHGFLKDFSVRFREIRPIRVQNYGNSWRVPNLQLAATKTVVNSFCSPLRISTGRETVFWEIVLMMARRNCSGFFVGRVHLERWTLIGKKIFTESSKHS